MIMSPGGLGRDTQGHFLFVCLQVLIVRVDDKNTESKHSFPLISNLAGVLPQVTVKL